MAGGQEERGRTTTAISDYFLDSVLATEGMLHGLGLERVVTGPSLSLSNESVSVAARA